MTPPCSLRSATLVPTLRVGTRGREGRGVEIEIPMDPQLYEELQQAIDTEGPARAIDRLCAADPEWNDVSGTMSPKPKPSA